ncbi:helix-hairpin-helix domain-containing protein [bacterium]|nr:helix-hairpin-helix domain-containing protein [bacterium]
MAGEIIDYRFFYGPFRTPHDIVKVRGIGEEKYQAIRNLVKTSSSGYSSYYHPPSPPPSQTDPYASGSSNKLNINIATQEELEALPGIGPAKARAIIDYRTRYGKFSKKEDVKNVPGIGDSIYRQIESSIVARGGAVTSNELELAYRNYSEAYRKFQSLQSDPYASYSEMRRAYDRYIETKKEYDRLVAKYGSR